MERAGSLPPVDSTGPYADTLFEEIPAFQSWSEGNVAQARAQLVAYDNGRMPPDPERIWFFYSALGELNEAERHIRHISDDDDRHFFYGWLAFLKGDQQLARKNFEQVKLDLSIAGNSVFVVLGRCGLWNKVEKNIQKSSHNDPGNEIVRGEHALMAGRTEEGIALLEKGTEAMQMMPTGAFYLGSESLAGAYQKQGNFEAALRVLQRASHAKGKAYNCIGDWHMLGALWLRTEWQLAELYRAMGRSADAEKVEDELRKMLVYADADHPIFRELQRRTNISVNSPVKREGD